MGYTPDGRDLVLKLFHGSVQQVTSADRPLFEHTTFSTQEIVFKDVFDQLERSEDQLDRGDREMTSCELMGVVDSARQEIRDARSQRAELTRSDLQVLLGRPPEPVPAPAETARRAPTEGLIAASSRRFRAPSGGGRRSRVEPHRGRLPRRRGGSNPGPPPRHITPDSAAAPGAPRLSDNGTVTSVYGSGNRTPPAGPTGTGSRSTRSGRSALPRSRSC